MISTGNRHWLALGLILAILASFQNSRMIFMGYCCWSALKPILAILARFHICLMIFMRFDIEWHPALFWRYLPFSETYLWFSKNIDIDLQLYQFSRYLVSLKIFHGISTLTRIWIHFNEILANLCYFTIIFMGYLETSILAILAKCCDFPVSSVGNCHWLHLDPFRRN